MLILISQLIGQSIVSIDEAESFGVVGQPIIDPANGKLTGFHFGRSLFQRKRAVLTTDDILSYEPTHLVVKRGEVARQVEEEPRLQAIIKQKIPVYGAAVITESGKHLGRANDLLLDTELGMIVKYYVKGLVQDRIIAAEQVVSIEKRGIIVEDTAQATGLASAEPAN